MSKGKPARNTIMFPIGTKVNKVSGKPFKSGNKVNTVKGYTINEHTGKLAFVFLEDDSVVDIRGCEKVPV